MIVSFFSGRTFWCTSCQSQRVTHSKEILGTLTNFWSFKDNTNSLCDNAIESQNAQKLLTKRTGLMWWKVSHWNIQVLLTKIKDQNYVGISEWNVVPVDFNWIFYFHLRDSPTLPCIHCNCGTLLHRLVMNIVSHNALYSLQMTDIGQIYSWK